MTTDESFIATCFATSTGYWEVHSSTAIEAAGFEKVKGWECLWVNKQAKLFLSIYVDDFKMSGKREHLPKAWQIIKDVGLVIDEPQEGGLFLGCEHEIYTFNYNCNNR